MTRSAASIRASLNSWWRSAVFVAIYSSLNIVHKLLEQCSLTGYVNAVQISRRMPSSASCLRGVGAASLDRRQELRDGAAPASRLRRNLLAVEETLAPAADLDFPEEARLGEGIVRNERLGGSAVVDVDDVEAPEGRLAIIAEFGADGDQFRQVAVEIGHVLRPLGRAER